MVRNLLSFIVAIFFISSTYAQLSEHEKLKKTERKALKFFENYQFTEAKPLYEKLVNSQPQNEEYILNMGICEYETNEDKNISADYFLKIVEKYRTSKNITNYTPTALYYLALSYKKLYLFDESAQCLSELNSMVDDQKQKVQLQDEIVKIKHSSDMFFNPVPMITSRLAVINSEYDDHTPIPTADGSKLFFTSKRPGGQGNYKDETGKLAEDIWVYDKNKGALSLPTNIGVPVNTEIHDATCGLSLDAKTLFIFKASKKVSGDIYMSLYKDSVWTQPVKLDKTINTRFIEKHAATSLDNKTIYFSSDRAKGKGGRDIWVSSLDAKGKWGKAKNFTLNTSGDEESPFLLADGKTMYFSSTGYPGMGGYDIFKTTLQDDGTWSQPENLGFPVNTVEDDVFYFPLADGKQAYYTQRNASGSDIYLAYLYDAESNDFLISGVVKDNKNYSNIETPISSSADTVVLKYGKIVKRKPVYYTEGDSVLMLHIAKDNTPRSSVYFVPDKSAIVSYDISTNKNSALYEPASDKGDYSFVIPGGKDTKVVYDAPNHIFDTKDIRSANTKKNIVYNPILVKIEKGKTYKAKCTPLDKKAYMDQFTQSELDLLSECMKKYPELYVNFSTEDYMLPADDIAKARKNAACDYLKKKGIGSERIFVDLSPDNISPDSIQYIVYDEETLKKAQDEKDNRKKITPPVEKWVTVRYHHYLFDFNSTQIDKKKNTDLDSLVFFLTQNPETEIEIIGYADAVGRDEYNDKLSQNRAMQLKEYMLKKGVKDNQISVSGYGESNPIAINYKSDKTWHKKAQVFNRRAEFRVLKQSEVKLKFEVIHSIPNEFKEPTYNSDFKK